MARAYRIIDNKEKARKLYEKALKLYPDYQKLINDLRDLPRYESIDLKNLKGYKNVPKSIGPMKYYL